MTTLAEAVDSGEKTRYPAVLRSGRPTVPPYARHRHPVSYTTSWDASRDASKRHHLAHHCADVAACFLTLARCPVFRARWEKAAGRVFSDHDLVRLAAVVFLHDAGKLHPGFQAKGWDPGAWRGPLFGHVREGLEIVMTCAVGAQLPTAGHLRIDALDDWGVQPSLLRAIISHYGRPTPELSSKLGPPVERYRAVHPHSALRHRSP